MIDQKAIEAARRIVEWADAGKLADDEWLVENNETAIINICRALLTASQARDEIVEALETLCDAIDAQIRANGGNGGISVAVRWARTQALKTLALKTGDRDAG
jgi:hypothetical protein